MIISHWNTRTPWIHIYKKYVLKLVGKKEGLLLTADAKDQVVNKEGI